MFLKTAADPKKARGMGVGRESGTVGNPLPASASDPFCLPARTREMADETMAQQVSPHSAPRTLGLQKADGSKGVKPATGSPDRMAQRQTREAIVITGIRSLIWLVHLG